jgi:PQQ enzyme repeat
LCQVPNFLDDHEIRAYPPFPIRNGRCRFGPPYRSRPTIGPYYHANPGRSGNFVVPALTFERARALHRDQEFQGRITGQVYAQPLYWRASGANSGMLLVATEENTVYALEAKTGKEIWSRSLGKPVARSSLSCGNIDPLGITGTPAIDPASETIYLDAMVSGSDGPRHLVFALSLKDGLVLPGWPIDVADALKPKGQIFIPRDQGERGALAIVGGILYVPFGMCPMCPSAASLAIVAPTTAESSAFR